MAVIIELGHFALVLALAVAVVQMVVPLWGTRSGDVRLMNVALPASLAQFVLTAVAFGALTYA
ncbi:MAG: hypothetical protein KKB37_13325, partial [Alphaproteobacteria bacterium]|nr:hypothetical protein [Alphaproteobacteria bacterium]